MDPLILLALIAGLAVLASPVAVVWLAWRLKRVERLLAETRRALALLEAGLGPVAEPGAPVRPTPLPVPMPADPTRATPWAGARMPEAADGAAAGAAIEAPASIPQEAALPPRQAPDLEEAVTSRFIVWVGGVAVALAALFLFRFAVEQGWLGPWPRVLLGLGLGAALISAGEWAGRTRPGGLARALPPDAVGPALTASGLFALYVSLYAAHALWGLIGAPVAFVILGAISIGAVGLAHRQGWFVALVGLAGGYLVPALLQAATPAAAPLFLFLFLLTAGCLALMTLRRWWFLSAAVLVGALGWPLWWVQSVGAVPDQGVLGLYVLGIAALFGIFGTDLPIRRPGQPARAWLVALVSHTSGLGFLLCGVLLLVVVPDGGVPASLAFGLYAALGLGLGRRHPAFEALAIAAALVTIAAVLLWPMPIAVTAQEELARQGVTRTMAGFGPLLLPPELRVFAWTLLGLAGLFGLGGFAAVRRAPTPALWAGLSAALPLVLLAVSYWRLGGFAVDPGWAGLAAALALANLAAASSLAREPGPRAFYAAASTAALALGFAGLLREAWLTVALALETLALAWIWIRTRVAALRGIAAGLIGLVIVRLVFNPGLLADHGLAWGLYAYGLPAAAFVAAARLWRVEPRDRLADLCEIAAAGCLLMLGAVLLRLWTAGTIAAPQYDLADMAAQTLWWLVAAALLLGPDLAPRLPWARAAGTGLLILAMVQLGLGHLLVQNPLWSADPVGAIPVLNLLGAAYLAPAVLLGTIGARRGDALDARLRGAVAGLAGLLAFAYVTLEVRRAFWNGVLLVDTATWPTPAEIYSYSAAWIVFALALLGIGIARQSRLWRALALAVLAAAVLKVFLYDMSDLTGLLRVASFLGLGLGLIGIGRIYRRFVFAG